MKTDTRCHSCGATNSSDALFCWRCHASTPSVRAVGMQPPSQGWGVRPFSPQPSRRRIHIPRPRGFWSWVRWIVAAFLIYAGVHWYMADQRVKMPDSIGTAVRSTGVEERRATQAEEDLENTMHAPADAAVYRTATGARFVVVAAAVEAIWALDELETFAGEAQNQGLFVRLVAATGFERDGVDYACAPYSGGGVGGHLCMWADGETLGLVMADGLRARQTERFTLQAYEAVGA